MNEKNEAKPVLGNGGQGEITVNFGRTEKASDICANGHPNADLTVQATGNRNGAGPVLTKSVRRG